MTLPESIAEQDAAITRALGIPSYVLGVPSQTSALDRQRAARAFRAYLESIVLQYLIEQPTAAPHSEESDE